MKSRCVPWNVLRACNHYIEPRCKLFVNVERNNLYLHERYEYSYTIIILLPTKLCLKFSSRLAINALYNTFDHLLEVSLMGIDRTSVV